MALGLGSVLAGGGGCASTDRIFGPLGGW